MKNLSNNCTRLIKHLAVGKTNVLCIIQTTTLRLFCKGIDTERVILNRESMMIHNFQNSVSYVENKI